MARLPHLSDEQWLQEVRDAHAIRAAFYYGIFCELRAAYGEEAALQHIGKVCREMGKKKRERYLPEIGDGTPREFCTYFCDHGSVNNKVFEMEPRGEKALLKRCALVDGWKAQAIPEEDIAKLCKAAREVDHGTLEGLGLAGDFETLIAEGADCCTLKVRKG